MLTYLVLPIIVLVSLLLAYVLAQDAHAPANRQFAWYMGVVALQNSVSVVRATTVDESLAYLSGAVLAPLIALDQLLLIWLVLALFLPRRFAQPSVRWRIALPYLLALAATVYDVVAGRKIWFLGVEQTSAGTFSTLLGGGFGVLLASLIVAQLVPIVLLAAIMVRHPERRAPAGVLLAGCLLAVLVSSNPQTPDLPVLYNLGPVPLYLAFAWITLRYQLFRPTPVALQVALDYLPDGVLFLDDDHRIRYANRAARQFLDLAQRGDLPTLPAALALAGLTSPTEANASGSRASLVREGPAPLTIAVSQTEIPGQRTTSHLLVLRDISHDEQREVALRAQNTEQGRLLELVSALETPAIGVAEGILLAPIVGTLDPRRARELTTRLLQTVSANRTRHVILDISGAKVVDDVVVRSLEQTSAALQLLGCRVTLTGISPAVATMITQFASSLDGITVARTPQEALAQQ